MNISKKPIEQQISWLSSHAAGVMKAHPMEPSREDFWKVVLNITNEVSSLQRRVDELKGQLLKLQILEIVPRK